MATDDDDAATLRERVRDLEQTVAQQQDTIQQLLPSRRAVLAGGAGLVGGVALTGQASAQSAAGQVGTSSEPVDVEAATVTATDVTTDSVSTEQADIGQLNSGIFRTETFSIDPGTTNAVDILSVGVGDDVQKSHLWIRCTVDTHNGKPSHKYVIANADGGHSNIDVVSSFRANSYRNQLADPTWDDTNQKWILSTMDKSGSYAGRGRFRIIITGVFGATEVLV